MQVSAREQRGRLIRALTGEGPGRAGWGRRPRCMPGQNSARDCGFDLKVLVHGTRAGKTRGKCSAEASSCGCPQG